MAAVYICEESPTGSDKETQSLMSCTDCVSEKPAPCADRFLFPPEHSVTASAPVNDRSRQKESVKLLSRHSRDHMSSVSLGFIVYRTIVCVCVSVCL